MNTPAIADALARLDAKPGYQLICGQCGHADAVPDDPEKSLYKCSECGARTAFGTLMARVTHIPHADRRFVVAKFEHGGGEKRVEVAFALDREYGAEIALDLLSVCDPGKFRALQAALTTLRDVPGAPRREDAIAELGEPAPADSAVCACGRPATFKNGACASCVARAVGVE
jgi:hypothetical protein